MLILAKMLTKIAELPVNRGAFAITLVISCVFGLTASSAGAVDFGANDVRTVFFIEKSSNRNRVDFGLRLDDACRPTGEQPVFLYWRDLESGPGQLSDLNAVERRGYGILSQRVATRGHRAVVYVQLNAVPDRLVQVAIRRNRTGCEVRAQMRIAGERAWLRRVFLNLSGVANLTVDSIDLHGLVDERPVTERIEPR